MNFRHFRLIAAVLLLAGAGAAHAQYVWLDARGRKHYSDQPPPPSVPEARVLQQPGSQSSAGSADVTKKDEPEPTAAPTIAERDAEFRKRRVERQEQEKKAAEEAQRAAQNRKRCEQMRDYQRVLASGERVARRGKNGEHQFLEDEERARELRDVKRMLEDCS